MKRCIFCDERANWEYRITPFVLGDDRINEYTCCNICKAFMVAGQRSAIIERVKNQYAKLLGPLSVEAQAMGDLHMQCLMDELESHRTDRADGPYAID